MIIQSVPKLVGPFFGVKRPVLPPGIITPWVSKLDKRHLSVLPIQISVKVDDAIRMT